MSEIDSITSWLEDPSLGVVRTVRPSQVAMSKSVLRVLQGAGEVKADPLDIPEETKKAYVSFLEGATGVGKSYAYLVPVIQWALHNKKRVIISTAQKTLQSQLYEKDLPALTARIGNVNYALLKGKSNYACKYRIKDGEENNEPHVYLPVYDQFRDWVNSHPTGDLESFPGDLSFIQHINVEECLWEKCAFKDKCGYLNTRNKVSGASIVVVNHALLALDLQFGGGKLLGEYDAIVIDEAHKAPKFFRDAYTLKLTLGILSRMEKLMDRMKVDQPIEYMAFKNTLNELFTGLSTLPQGEFVSSVELSAIINEAAGHARALRKVLNVPLPEVVTDIEIPDDAIEEEAPEPEAPRGNLKAQMARKAMGDLFAKLEQTFNVINCPVTDQTEYLLALEEERGSNYRSWLALKAMPIEIGPLVGPALRGIGKVIVTSATLSAAGEFGFMSTEFGFSPRQLVEATQFSSSFDYKSHSLLYLNPSLPEYNYNDKGNYYTALSKEMMELVKASQGGAFILCASRQDLDMFYNVLLPECREAGLTLMTQGRSMEQDVAAFKATPGAVLMGLHSLWEGVDVPGLALRLVIIPRLPFPNKSDTLLQARKRLAAERLIEAGVKESDANFKQFSAFDLQLAALYLAQGAGRLIRSENDFGVVAVLDRRITGTTKNYSSFLRRALPHPVITLKPPVLNFLAKLAAKVKNTL